MQKILGLGIEPNVIGRVLYENYYGVLKKRLI